MDFSSENPFHIIPRCQDQNTLPPPGLEKAASRLSTLRATLKPISLQAEAYMGFIASFFSPLYAGIGLLLLIFNL